MRPAGDVSIALLAAAGALARDDRAPTVRELAQHAGVGLGAATSTVKNLSRAGKLRQARQRPVRRLAGSKIFQTFFASPLALRVTLC